MPDLQQILDVCNQPANAQWYSSTGCWIGLYIALLFSFVLMLSLFNKCDFIIIIFFSLFFHFCFFFFFCILLLCLTWLLCLGIGSANYYYHHCYTTQLFGDFQSSYRCHHSCETAMVKVHNDVVSMLDAKLNVILLLFDLTGAAKVQRPCISFIL